MKWWHWPVIGLFLMGAYKPLYQTHENEDKVTAEFINIEESVQTEDFTVRSTTPNLTDLKDGQIVIFSSGSVKLMFRQLNDIYSVNASCITIRR